MFWLRDGCKRGHPQNSHLLPCLQPMAQLISAMARSQSWRPSPPDPCNYLNTASNGRWPKAEDEPQSRKSGQQSRKRHTAHRHKQHTVAMGKTTRANVQPQSRKRVARLALLERICQASGNTVRHIIQLPGDLSAGDLAREVEEYREVGWRVSILWRGSWAVMVFLSKHSVLSTSTNHRSLSKHS